MKCVYRIKTMYHLLLVLLILDSSKENILYIEARDLFYIKKTLLDLGFFSKIVLQNRHEEIKINRILKTITNAFFYQIFNAFFKKDRIIYCSQHNIRGSFFIELLHAKHIVLLEDGFSSYEQVNDGIKNSLYRENHNIFFFKIPLNGYFLNIKNRNILRFIYTSPERLRREVPNAFTLIESKITKVSITAALQAVSSDYKDKLKSLFFDNKKIDFKDRKSIVILTQPLVEDAKVTQIELLNVIAMFDDALASFENKGYSILIKQHPRENNSSYKELINKYCIQELEKDFPFEILSLFDVKFDVGITYYSTAVESEIFRKKIMLRKNN